MQTRHLCGGRLRLVVTRSAQGHKISWIVGRGNSPRDNVVNVKFLSLPRKRALLPSALAARIAIPFPDGFSYAFPFRSALIMPRCSAFPVWVVFARFADNLGRNVAAVAAKPTWIAVKGLKRGSATFAGLRGGSDSAPSGFVVTCHVAKTATLRPRSSSLKYLSATLASFGDAIARPAFAALCALVPRRRTISAGAINRAILSRCATNEVRAAFGAGVVNWLCHKRSMSNFQSKSNYFEIACKRVQEVVNNPPLFIPEQPKPTQEALDL